MLRGEKALYFFVGNGVEGRRIPTRCLVFIDQTSANAFEKIGTGTKIERHIPFPKKNFF